MACGFFIVMASEEYMRAGYWPEGYGLAGLGSLILLAAVLS